MEIDGRVVHAVITREALEALWGPAGCEQADLLDRLARPSRGAIEAVIVRR